MSVEQAFRDIQAALAANLPVVVGSSVGLVVLAGVWVLSRRRQRRAVPIVPSPHDDDDALSWAPPEPSYADRRESVRRDGPPVRVVVAGAGFRNGVVDGLVVDRSTGGLKLILPAGVAPGTTVRVRAANAPDTVGFVSVLVRSCRPGKDQFEVGAEFEKTPPWNVLLLFG